MFITTSFFFEIVLCIFYDSSFITSTKDGNQKFLDLINNSINDGVYKCGFARNQSAYEKASKNLFAAINEIENLLQKNKGDWIFGEELTYADIYLFPTLIRLSLIHI